MKQELFAVGEWCGEYNGWVWVTDGHMLVIAKGSLPEGRPVNEHPQANTGIRKMVDELAAIPDAGGMIASHSALERIAGCGCATCDGSGRRKCNRCGGSGTRVRHCRHCEHEHRCQCSACDDGRMECLGCGARKCISIHGAPVDWRFLRRALRASDASAFRFLNDTDNSWLAMIADGFRAVIMRLNDMKPEESIP